MRKLLLAAAVAALHTVLPAPASAQAPPSAAPAGRIGALVQATMAEEHIPGTSVAVLRGADTVVMRGWGFADLENRVPASERTVYRIGSLTKQFTAVAVLQLAEQGRLSLDDTLQRFVPGFRTPARHITIRHLLTHTSGIPNYTAIGAPFMSRLRLDLPPESIVGLVRGRPGDFPPGQRFRYSNTGYVLLGMVIERASGEPYADYIARHETEPLGLGDTRYCGNRPIVPRRAQGYVEDSTGIVNADYISMTIPFSAGSLCSTVLDLVTWQRALWADRLLQRGGYNSMTTPPRLADGTISPYGFGLGVGTLGTHRQVAHSGGINGFSSALYTWPDDSLIVVVLTNSEDANASRLAQRIARIVFDIPEPTVRDLPLTAAERAPYQGTYQLRTLRLRIFSRGDSLFGQAEGQSAFRLLAQGGNAFVAAFDADTHADFVVEGARARALDWTQGGVTTRAPRVD